MLENGAPGNIWQPGTVRNASGGRTVVTEYAVNDALDVPYIRLTATGGIADSFYPAGKLYKNVTKDENWTSGKVNTTEEFKDFEGRIVMKRAWKSSTVSLMTFYVYDDFGNLRFVIPPFPGAPSVVTLNENDAVSKQYCYVYKYDERNRLIAKRLPGKEWEYFIYNKLDQLVLTQNARQRDEHKWMFTKYDALGRVAVTGIYINSGSPSSLQATVSNQTFLWESWAGDNYTSVAFPQTFNYYQTILKYDNYNFPNPPTYVLTTGVSTRTTGLVTASSNFIDNTASYLTTVNYYDDYGRVIKSFEQHYASSSVLEGNYDEISNAYTFAGELKASTRVHRTGAAATTIAMNYEYDAWGRKVKTREKINADAQVLVSENLYSEIGRVKEKKLHNGLQSTTFTYNQRGWLKSKTSNQFSELLKYEDGTTPQYNGNISNQNWGFAATTPNVFTYTYDALSRLTNAAATNLSEAITYDDLGNILTMNRNGSSGSYTYDGNRLLQISGALATQPYIYDDAGNVTTDGRNGVSITYTMDGLPKTISKTGLSMTYLYDSQGNRLKKTSNATGVSVTTNYVDGIHYTGNNIDFIQTEEGIARRNGNNYSYEYNLTDHLGNVRATFNRNPNTGAVAVLQKDDYFAFGKRSAVQAGTNKYLYNGKELQEGVEMYDYGVRFYDPVIGRWNVIDPLAEQMRRHSPYNYAFNNPIRFVDPDGMAPTDDYKLLKNGVIELVAKTDDKTDKLYATSANGEIDKSKSLTIEKGILDNGGQDQLRTASGMVKFDYYQANGEQARNLFSFAANNSDVEWGLSVFSDDKNYVTTSHSETSEAGIVGVVVNKEFGHQPMNMLTPRLVESTHSHPMGVTNPSGLTSEGDNTNRGGDMSVTRLFESRYYTPINYNIYTPSNRKYTPYSSKSKMENLMEIIITAPRRRN